MKYLSLLFFWLFLSAAATSQVHSDSLWNVWRDEGQPDTVRLKAIQALAWSMLYSKPDSTHLLGQLELRFAEQVRNKRWQGKAWNVIGATQNLQGDFPGAIKSYEKGLVAMEEASDLKGIAALNNNIGLVYRNLGRSSKAMEYYQKDLAIQERLNNKLGIPNANNNIGLIYNDLGNFSKALEYYFKSMRQTEEEGDKYGMALAYNNIGSVYFSLKNYSKALEYYKKSLPIRQELDDQQGIATIYSYLGLVYKELARLDLSLEYLQKSTVIQEKLDDKPGLALTYHSTGIVYNKLQDFQTAIQWCNKSLDLSRQIKSLRTERDACYCLYTNYKAVGNTPQALVFHEEYLDLSDSLSKEETNKRLEQMDLVRKVMADSLGQEEAKLKMEVAHQNEVRRKNQVMILLMVTGMGILVFALGILSRMLYFRKNSQMFQTKAENLEKQQLINEIALLKTQVNPHFLFNSLSILSSLVHTNPDLSEQFIDQLSRSYRYILEQKEQSLVKLRTELEFIRSYSFLLKIRFEDKFDLRFHLSETALDQYKIAPLTLQLLIENAVKHNRMSAKEPLLIEIFIENDYLMIRNRLQLRPQRETSTGTGLNNIIDRYALLTDRPVWAGECDEDFLVKIPLLNS